MTTIAFLQFVSSQPSEFLTDDTCEKIMFEFIEKPKEVKPLLIAKISTECTHGLCADF